MYQSFRFGRHVALFRDCCIWHWARDKKTNALGPYVCDWHSIVVVSKGPFRVGSGEVGIGREGGSESPCAALFCAVPCRAVPCPHGGGGGAMRPCATERLLHTVFG